MPETPATLRMDSKTTGAIYKGLRVIGTVLRLPDGAWIVGGQPERPMFQTLYDSPEAAARACAKLWGTELADA